MAGVRALLCVLAAGAIVAGALLYVRTMTPLTHHKLPAGPPVAWATAGGGWRAMAAGMGFARAFDRAGLLHDEALTHAGSNSGGTWFLAQFTYSEPFYASVVGPEDLEGVVVSWMDRQAPVLRRPLEEVLRDIDAWIGDNAISGVVKALVGVLWTFSSLPRWAQRLVCSAFSAALPVDECLTLTDELTSGLVVGSEFEGSWGLYLRKMVELADADMVTRPATLRARVGGFSRPELLFQVSNLTSSLSNSVATLGPTNTWRVDEAGAVPGYDVGPVAWVVPGAAHAEGTEGANSTMPMEGEEAGADVAGFVTAPVVVAAGASSVAHVLSRFRSEPSPALLGGDVSPAWYAAAISSAFAGFAGSPNLTDVLLGTALGAATGEAPEGGNDELLADVEGDVLAAVEGNLSLVGPACTDPRVVGSTDLSPQCRRVVDSFCSPPYSVWKALPCVLGVWAFCRDSFQNFLADFAPCGASPDIPLDFSDRTCPFPAARVADGGYVDNTAAAQTLGRLQGGRVGARLRMVITVNYDVSGGAPLNASDAQMLFGGAPPLLFPATPPRVFAADWSEVRLGRVQGTAYAYAARVSTTTVANEAFGVLAGSPVDVLLLALAGPIPLTIGISTDPDDYALLGRYAADAAGPAVVAEVRRWANATKYGKGEGEEYQ